MITILKALKDGIRVIDPEDSRVVEDYILFIVKFADGWGISTFKGQEFLFTEYGKKWALTEDDYSTEEWAEDDGGY